MSKNTELVKQFYQALSQHDYNTANSLYHSNATYNDEIFSFRGIEIHALWYRACLPDMQLSANLESLYEEDDKVISEWEMAYTLDTINRRIVLKETGVFQFLDGKILVHTDSYDFWSWCTQAFGSIGRVLGWSSWLKKRVRYQARISVLAHLYSAQPKINKK